MRILGPSLPNLNDMCFFMINYLLKNKKSQDKLNSIKEKCKFVNLDFDITMFPQIWGSTCTAFDILPNGEPVWGGSAMTKAYTVIIHEFTTDTYGVFIDDKPCYIVTDPTEMFYEDLKNKNMKSLSNSLKYY